MVNPPLKNHLVIPISQAQEAQKEAQKRRKAAKAAAKATAKGGNDRSPRSGVNICRSYGSEYSQMKIWHMDT